MLLKALPLLSFGFFTEDVVEMTRAIHDVGAELYITLMGVRSDSGNEFDFQFNVSAPSIYLEHECTALAALELAKDKDDSCGVLSPAQALQDTDFWKRLKQIGHLRIHTEIVNKSKND